MATREPVVQSYYNAAIWAQLSNPPTLSELKQGFKIAFKERSLESPCYGGVEGISGSKSVGSFLFVHFDMYINLHTPHIAFP